MEITQSAEFVTKELSALAGFLIIASIACLVLSIVAYYYKDKRVYICVLLSSLVFLMSAIANYARSPMIKMEYIHVENQSVDLNAIRDEKWHIYISLPEYTIYYRKTELSE